MTRRSLRLRLLAGAAAAVAVALVVALVVMSLLFERHLTRSVETELVRIGTTLAASLRLEADGRPAVDAPPADPRFDAPASGLYWQVSDAAGAARSRSLWDQTLTQSGAASPAGWAGRRVEGPFGPPLFLVEREVTPDRGGPAVRVQVATDLTTITDARDAFARELALFLLVLWAVLAAAAWVQVELGLAPLAQVRAALGGLRSDPAARLGAAGFPDEIAPLASAIDALAAAREDDLARARRRAADLAHSLKTPLSALAAETRRVRDAGAQDAATGLERAHGAIAAAIEHELARARVARAAAGGAEAEVLPVIERLIGVVERTDDGATLVFESEAPQGFTLPLPAEDLAEVAGPLLENAARYARRRVKVSAARFGDRRELIVEDDGPGLDAERAPEALRRGIRLDEAGGGHGLGLAIARDLTEASGGTLALEPSSLGGLAVRLTWA